MISVLFCTTTLQADHTDCVGLHLAEGVSPRGGGLILQRVLNFAEGASSEAQMRRTYSVSAPQFCRCKAPLAFTWGHKLARRGPDNNLIRRSEEILDPEWFPYKKSMVLYLYSSVSFYRITKEGWDHVVGLSFTFGKTFCIISSPISVNIV